MTPNRIKAPSPVKAPIFADFWMTVGNGMILGFCRGVPPQELVKGQIKLSEEDYWRLKRLWNKNSIEDFHAKVKKLKWIQTLINH